MDERHETKGWSEVARRVNLRMAELDLSQAQLAKRADVSPATVRAVTTAERETYRKGSLRSLSKALGWAKTAIEDLAATGKEPVLWVDPGTARADLAHILFAGSGPNEDALAILARIDHKLDLVLARLGAEETES